MRWSAAHRSRPRQGETANGDSALIREDGGHTLLAVVDALGHGPLAADAAQAALRCLEQVSLTAGLASVLESLHQALRGGRGAAAMLALYDGRTLRCGGVGNVELRALGTKIPVLPTPGILGQHVRAVREAEVTPALGDRLVLFSDGVSSRLELDMTRGLTPEAACALLLERYGRETDDATVLVADVENP
ncbi:SpoIIE family protein phosphatase [Myxococcaceae bacterium JPH2]|nr:SpoIIE family protein phosphatase [Myxococcaceae bacterium JPH2]